MPKRTTTTKPGTKQVLINSSFESLAVAWLMQDGWQVFLPVLDNAHKTDILISDGPCYFRVQIKTIEAANESQKLRNQWQHSNLDYVVCFARNSNWGYVMPAFTQYQRSLNHAEHIKFKQTKSSFLKAFHSL